MSTIGDQLRAIAAQIDALPAGTGGAPTREPVPAGESRPVWNADGTCAADYWMMGTLGAMKGCHNAHYAEAHMIMGMLGEDIPRHLSVVQPVPKSLPWISSLISAGDLGWIDASGYNPIPVEGSFKRWIAAGCPSKNANAAYDVRGQPIRADAWAEVYNRMAEKRQPGAKPDEVL